MDKSLLEHDLRLMKEAMEDARKMAPTCKHFAEAVKEAAPVLARRMLGAHRKKSLKESIDDYEAWADRRIAELLARDRR